MSATSELVIGQKAIGDASDCYVIAEIGHNHQGSLEKCKELFYAAHRAGADAVKLQKRDNKTLYTRAAYDKPYENRNSYGPTYGAHREFLEFGKGQYRELQALAADLGLDFFATAFDIPSAEFLAGLEMPAFKIASGDLRSIPLLKFVAALGKPVILSTGGGTFEDIVRAYDAIAPINPNICIMQCTAGYPPEWSELNLRVIDTLRRRFPEIVIGFSSHDSGIAMAIAAYMLGARVIEKHFTLNRALKGTDHAFSLEPVGLTKMVRDLRRLRLALGDGLKKVYESERAPIEKMSKSIVAKRDLRRGQTIVATDLAMKSPGGGLSPAEWENVIGKVVISDLSEDEIFSWDKISGA